MTNTHHKKEHFNLYYIFKEDKEQNLLPLIIIHELWNRLSLKTEFEEYP